MSIRAIARDLYRAQQNVDSLERQYANAPVSEQVSKKVELEIARKELDMLRRMLDGEKESGDFRKRFDGFGGGKWK